MDDASAQGDRSSPQLPPDPVYTFRPHSGGVGAVKYLSLGGSHGALASGYGSLGIRLDGSAMGAAQLYTDYGNSRVCTRETVYSRSSIMCLLISICGSTSHTSWTAVHIYTRTHTHNNLLCAARHQASWAFGAWKARGKCGAMLAASLCCILTLFPEISLSGIVKVQSWAFHVA